MNVDATKLFFDSLLATLVDEYLGKLSENSYNADSISNAHGQYGSEYSGSSINNSYHPDSPNNPYGEGL